MRTTLHLAFHCHLIYHLVTGMFTVLRYDGADVQFWYRTSKLPNSRIKSSLSRRQSLSASAILVFYISVARNR